MLLCLRKQARKSPTTEMSYYVVCALLGFSVQKSGLKIWKLITVEMKEQSHLCCTGSLGTGMKCQVSNKFDTRLHLYQQQI